MPENEKEKIVEYLSQCSNPELREILFAVFKTRRPNPEEDQYNNNCFFLGTSSSLLQTGKGEQEHSGSRKVEADAYVDREEYGENAIGTDWGFCNFGECQSCGIAVRSDLKRGVCTVCGSKVFMT